MILWVEESYGQVTIQIDPLQQVLSQCSVFYEIRLETFVMNYIFGHHYEWKMIKEPRYVIK